VMDANTVFAEWLRTARTEAGLSQQKVAERMREAGYTTFRQTKVLKIEQATTALFLNEAVALAALFGTTLDVALGVKASPPEHPAVRDLAERTSLLRQLRDQIDAELGGAS